MKPHTSETMLMSTVENGLCNTYVMPLCPIHVFEWGDDKVEIVIEYRAKEFKFEEGSFVTIITDDPYQSWAGDWIQLGCYAFRWTLKDCKRVKEDPLIHVIGKQDEESKKFKYRKGSYRKIYMLPGRTKDKLHEGVQLPAW